ncbi:hypothetical protein [Nocardioides sp.]|uniref:hypothetical protein n=1 Tax=Nocardioides sp. TaxID=35761 RepID=UPI00286D05E4|nr:hypothetical protein [Nocardioides sp.]
MKVVRPALVGLVSWLAVVAVGSTLVWTVISHVGDGLVTVPEPRPGASGSVVAGGVGDPPGRSPGRSPSSRPGQTIGPSARPSADPSAAPSSGSTDPSQAESPADSSAPVTPPVSSTALPTPQDPSESSSEPASPGPATPPSTPSAPTPRRATWQGLGGTVEAECRGSAISLVAAQPTEGFRAEVKKAGPEELEVEFEGREEESGSGSQVSARCQGGEPRFSAETEDDETDD